MRRLCISSLCRSWHPDDRRKVLVRKVLVELDYHNGTGTLDHVIYRQHVPLYAIQWQDILLYATPLLAVCTASSQYTLQYMLFYAIRRQNIPAERQSIQYHVALSQAVNVPYERRTHNAPRVEDRESSLSNRRSTMKPTTRYAIFTRSKHKLFYAMYIHVFTWYCFTLSTGSSTHYT